MVWAATIALVFAEAAPALVPATAPPQTLWRNLAVGDTPEVVGEKLRSIDEVKAVRVVPGKKPKVKVSYRKGGIKILDGTFEIVPVFKDGVLSNVGLKAVNTYLPTAHDRYTALLEALQEKYPKLLEADRPLSISDFLRAGSAATSSEPTTLFSILTDESVVVVFGQQFTDTDAPSGYYGSGSFAQIAREIAWGIYEGQSKECGGTGRRRVNFVLQYMPSAEFARINADSEKANTDAKVQASQKL